MEKFKPLPEFSMKKRAEFWNCIDIGDDDECWNWKGRYIIYGYGRFWMDNYKWLSHRLAYYFWSGMKPDDICVLHSCDNPTCCNPSHLFIGTHQDNMTDKAKKGRVKSVRGENNPNAKLSEDNIREIRYSGISVKELSKKFNRPPHYISQIKSGCHWGWI